MTTEQREALRQDVVRWIQSSEFAGFLREMHLNPLELPLAFCASLFHVGGLGPADIFRGVKELGLATPRMRRRYLKLAQGGKIAQGFICRVQQHNSNSRRNQKPAQIIAGLGGTPEDDQLVESCLEMHEALRAKNAEFPPPSAGAPSRPCAAGKSVYDFGEPGSIFVFNAFLPDAALVPAEGRPFALCVINPQLWPAILPIPFSIAKAHASAKDFPKSHPLDKPEWLEKEYPTWQAAMHAFLKERIKRERREFHDSLNDVQLTELVVTLNNLTLKTVQLDAVISARTGEIEKLRHCLSSGVSPNFKGLLYNAVVTGSAEAVELLLTTGAAIHQPVDGDGNTYLHEAVLHNQPAIAKLLLNKGADANRKTKNGQTPLHYAYERPGESAALIELLEPLTKLDRPSYNVEEFLRMGNSVKAYYALSEAIGKGFRQRSPVELRVLSLAEFIGHCWPNGIITMDGHSRWAIIPCAELFDAIDEPVFAKMLWQCATIIREYGQKIGCEPFGTNSDDFALDEDTENKLYSSDFDFCKYDCDDETLCRKTMDYVRKNRHCFLTTAANKP